jgi:putative ABC transport system permease protein
VETLRVIHGQPFRGGRIAIVGLSDAYLDEIASAATWVCASVGDERTTGGAAIASENLARRFNIRPGETLAVESPTGAIEVAICGTIADFTSDQGSIIVPARLLRARWRDDLLNYISVDLRAGSDTSTLRRQVTEQFGADHGLMIYDTGELRATIEQVLTDAFREVDGIQLLVFAITFVGIVDLVASTVIDRRREFTLLRAVGARDLVIARSVALETGILGATAGGLAVIAGALFARLWLAFIYPVLVGYVLMPNFAWRAAGTVMGMSLITAAAAGYAASRVALRSLRKEASARVAPATAPARG